MKKPTHCYIARKPDCGCFAGLANDMQDKHTAKFVADFIKAGYQVFLVPWKEYVNEVSQEDTFLGCPHYVVEPEQLMLFEDVR